MQEDHDFLHEVFYDCLEEKPKPEETFSTELQYYTRKKYELALCPVPGKKIEKHLNQLDIQICQTFR